MKEVVKVVKAWDDFAAANGGRVEATDEVYLRIIHRNAQGATVRDEEVELDLSSQHVGSLEAATGVWFKIGHRPGPGWVRRRADGALESAGATPVKKSAAARATDGMPRREKLDWFRDFRAWIVREGRTGEVTGDQASPYYRNGLVKDYLAYLDSQKAVPPSAAELAAASDLPGVDRLVGGC